MLKLKRLKKKKINKERLLKLREVKEKAEENDGRICESNAWENRYIFDC